MTNIELIKKVLSSNLLIPEMKYAPPNGASTEELAALDKSLSRSLSQSHKDILERWNGLNLDVVRIYGATPTKGEIEGLINIHEEALINQEGYIVFGGDPAGFIYAEDSEGQVWTYDYKCDNLTLIAQSMDDFFQNYLFGLGAAAFAGDSWVDELKAAGII